MNVTLICDPSRIFALALRAIDLRDGNSVVPAYIALRSADPQRADRFALQALEAARSNYDSFLLFGLAQVAAPLSGVPKSMQAPQELRSQILDVLAAGMLRPPQLPADKQNICKLATPVTMAMKAFPPAQQAQLRIAVDHCKATDAQLSDTSTRSATAMPLPATCCSRLAKPMMLIPVRR